ncbi:MAG: permease [Pseudomonadota bacterium]
MLTQPTPSPSPAPRPARAPDHYLSLLLAAGVLVMFGGALINRTLDLGRGQPAWLEAFASYFLAICLEAVPFILLGALVTAVLEVWLPAETLPRLTARLGVWGVPAVALLSPLFPVCECGVVMVARGLMRKGLPLPHAVTYLLAAPIVNPTVLAATYIAYQDIEHPLWRGLGGFMVAVAVGWAVLAIKPRQALAAGLDPAPAPAPAATPPGFQSLDSLAAPAAPACGCGHDHPPAEGVFGRVAGHLADDFAEMMPYFLAGVFLASGIKTFLSGEVLAALGGHALTGPIAMMVLAAVLSLCSEADAFVAASFTEFGFTSHIAFLVLGPMFDLKLMLAYRLIFRSRFILLLSGLIWLGVALFTAGLGWLK